MNQRREGIASFPPSQLLCVIRAFAVACVVPRGVAGVVQHRGAIVNHAVVVQHHGALAVAAHVLFAAAHVGVVARVVAGRTRGRGLVLVHRNQNRACGGAPVWHSAAAQSLEPSTRHRLLLT